MCFEKNNKLLKQYPLDLQVNSFRESNYTNENRFAIREQENIRFSSSLPPFLPIAAPLFEIIGFKNGFWQQEKQEAQGAELLGAL